MRDVNTVRPGAMTGGKGREEGRGRAAPGLLGWPGDRWSTVVVSRSQFGENEKKHDFEILLLEG